MRFITLSVLALILVSCSPKINEGEVYEKEHHPACTTIIIMPVVISAGKTFRTILMPIPFFYPEKWHISYKAFNEKENRWDTATVWVNKSVFDAVEIGHWYKRTKDDLDERPRIKADKAKGARK